MTATDPAGAGRIPLSRAQRNIYNGVLQDPDPLLYLIGKRYRLRPIAVARVLRALTATVAASPIQLCVLVAGEVGGPPDWAVRLRFDDIVRVRADDDRADDPQGCDTSELSRAWATGLLGKPLVRYTVRTDATGMVVGLDVHTHHVLLDGGATAIIESNLARHLDGDATAGHTDAGTALTALAHAHRREDELVESAGRRHAATVRRELAELTWRGGQDNGRGDAVPGTAARGVLRASVRVPSDVHDDLVALSDSTQIPMNILVAGAAVAVNASLRLCTETLLVQPVDNRFAEPELNVATCLVNSVAQPVQFAPFASVHDVVTSLDRGYVKAARRRWFREEQYRRLYLTLHGRTHVEALTVNYMQGLCAPSLLPFLSEPPVVTAVGPVEGMTVTCVHDPGRRTLNIGIWNRADAIGAAEEHRVARRIADALAAMRVRWNDPMAALVDEWVPIADDGTLHYDTASVTATGQRAWFAGPEVDTARLRTTRVESWIATILRCGAQPGDVVVFVDEGTAVTTDLMMAAHLAGCGYSVCGDTADLTGRATAISEHGGPPAHVVDTGGERPTPDDATRRLVDERVRQTLQDPALAASTAYVMPTGGSTGSPKLVPVSHEALAMFCAAIRHQYGWGYDDVVLQTAALTSDISVEEIFGAAYCGARLVRSTALRAGDLHALAGDVVAERATIIDLPTALWHLLCEDKAALHILRSAALRHVIVGGEAIRPAAVDTWVRSIGNDRIDLISTYGPTEATVVAAVLPMTTDGTVTAAENRTRLGRPMIPGSLFVAFGEVIIIGSLVSAGYLGYDSPAFGTIAMPDGSRRRVFATADRVSIDADGFPVFAGRRDAIVKIAGKRVDLALVNRQIIEDPAVSDVAVEGVDGTLAVWFQARNASSSQPDSGATARIRAMLAGLRIGSYCVTQVADIPRKPNGKVDADALRATVPEQDSIERQDQAVELAHLWGRHLGRTFTPDSSLLDEGVGSLDLIRILPPTRAHLNWQLTVLDLISADTAARLVRSQPVGDTWMDADTVAAIEQDLASSAIISSTGTRGQPSTRGETTVVFGASGIVGTGFGNAVLRQRIAGEAHGDVVFVSRSPLPDRSPWSALREVGGVEFVTEPGTLTAGSVRDLLHRVSARSVVNCIGNTNVLVPYTTLRPANVTAVSAIAEACAAGGISMVHLSTFVVSADVSAPRVTDPRSSPYPYAASKSLAEILLANADSDLDFSIVRLPRVLAETTVGGESADILAAVVDACTALGACPNLDLVEDVTTNTAAAQHIIGQLPVLSDATELGRGITVLRGERVAYTDFLRDVTEEVMDVAQWKHRLDRSDWARQNLRRWGVLDAWVSLGVRLGGRSYTEYLAAFPTVEVDVDSVREVSAAPVSVWNALRR